MILYKELSLPNPPNILINQVIDNWINKYKTFKVSNYSPNLRLEFLNIEDKNSNVVSTTEVVDQNLGKWLCDEVCAEDNLYNRWRLRMLHFFNKDIDPNQKIEVYKKHLDTVPEDNNYPISQCVLIYNLTDSIGDLVFYQQKNHPIVRNDRPIYIGHLRPGSRQLPHKITEYNETEEIFRCTPQPRTWYLVRNDIIHSVENCNQVPRLALQLRLTKHSVNKYFPDFTF